GLVLGAARLERGDVLGGGRDRLALRDEVVAAVARLHGDPVTEVAEVGDALQQDQCHGKSPYSLASRGAATVAARTGSKYRDRAALREAVVAAVVRLHGDPVSEVAEVGDALQQDQFHGKSPYSLAARGAATVAVRTGWKDLAGAARTGGPAVIPLRCCGCRC